MNLLFLLILLIFLFSASIRKKENWKETYINYEQSRNIEGVFVLLIFLGHAIRYFDSYTPLDIPYIYFVAHLDQAVVAMYMFYSGYGITRSVKNKGIEYIKTFPLRRFLPLFLKYEIVQLLFLSVRLFIGNAPDIKTIVLLFTGWENLGNYGWYVLVTLSIYILFMISFFISLKFCKSSRRLIIAVSIMTVLLVILMLVLCFPGQRKRWFYDTILVFSFGSWYSLLKEKFEDFLDSPPRFTISTVICVAVYVVTAYFRSLHFLIHEMWIFSFTIAVLLLTVKVRFKSRILEFFGRLALPMYILQGLPFMIFFHLNIQTSPYIFVILSFSVTVLLAIVFNKISSLIIERK